MAKTTKPAMDAVIETKEAPKKKETINIDSMDFSATISAIGNLEPKPRATNTKAAIVRKLYDDINSAKAKGVTMAQIAESLTQTTGIEFTLFTLRNALANIN